MKALRDYQDGKLILHAWLSRGLSFASDIATWRFNGDESKVAELMERTPHAMNDLLSLEALPDTGDEDAKKLSEQAANETLAGESRSHWCVLDLGASSSNVQPMPLPDWFKIPLDRTIAIWNHERIDWEQKRQHRFHTKGTYELSKVAEEKYQDRGELHIEHINRLEQFLQNYTCI